MKKDISETIFDELALFVLELPGGEDKRVKTWLAAALHGMHGKNTRAELLSLLRAAWYAGAANTEREKEG